MHHLSEHIIERLLTELSLEQCQIDDVKAHLAECTECRAIYSWLKSFYRELDQLDVRTQEEERRSDLFPTGTIRLSPISFKSLDKWNRSNHIILAADAEEEKSRYEHTVTLASENTQYLIRILHDTRKDNYKLFVIGPEKRRKNSLVELPILNKELITDEQGKIDFYLSRNVANRKWENIDATLRTPVANVYLNEDQIAKVGTSGSSSVTNNGYDFRLDKGEKSDSFEEDRVVTLTIRSQHTFQRKITKALLKGASKQKLLRLNDGHITIPWPVAASFSELSILGYE